MVVELAAVKLFHGEKCRLDEAGTPLRDLVPEQLQLRVRLRVRPFGNSVEQ
jgi:hypothetical protein